jgi:hypothetical protein
VLENHGRESLRAIDKRFLFLVEIGFVVAKKSERVSIYTLYTNRRLSEAGRIG